MFGGSGFGSENRRSNSSGFNLGGGLPFSGNGLGDSSGFNLGGGLPFSGSRLGDSSGFNLGGGLPFSGNGLGDSSGFNLGGGLPFSGIHDIGGTIFISDLEKCRMTALGPMYQLHKDDKNILTRYLEEKEQKERVRLDFMHYDMNRLTGGILDSMKEFPDLQEEYLKNKKKEIAMKKALKNVTEGYTDKHAHRRKIEKEAEKQTKWTAGLCIGAIGLGILKNFFSGNEEIQEMRTRQEYQERKAREEAEKNLQECQKKMREIINQAQIESFYKDESNQREKIEKDRDNFIEMKKNDKALKKEILSTNKKIEELKEENKEVKEEVENLKNEAKEVVFEFEQKNRQQSGLLQMVLRNNPQLIENIPQSDLNELQARRIQDNNTTKLFEGNSSKFLNNQQSNINN